MQPADRRFAERAVRRKRVFLWLAAAGVAAALGLSCFYAWRRAHDPRYPLGARAALVLLILLNARQNLRQYRYARALEGLMR
jgi:hypothetical protein